MHLLTVSYYFHFGLSIFKLNIYLSIVKKKILFNDIIDIKNNGDNTGLSNLLVSVVITIVKCLHINWCSYRNIVSYGLR